LSHGVARFGSWARRFGEELASGVLPELVGQLPEAADGIAESFGDFRGRQAIDKIGSQGFTLPMGSVLGSQKGLSQVH
jgi:hypothetical protein